MKLITEFTENDSLKCLIEKKENGEKNYVIEGVFAQADKKNRNGRIYPKPIMEKAVNKYVKEQVSKKRAVGELNHPEGPTVNLDKVSHLITDLKFEGNNVVGKAQILPTPMGEIVKGLLDGGVQLGVSTRGMGSLSKGMAQWSLKTTLCLVRLTSYKTHLHPKTFVNGIMEGVEWVWNNGILSPQVIEEMETEIKTTPKAFRPEVQIREFKNFLSLIKSQL